ncbi:MAG: 3-hydroxyacyl-CoA dehydrogenase [Salinarimonas sp.]|nr:3-hydroxyacyl-CoA dehydrogenase [Salinarimonas sp.]
MAENHANAGAGSDGVAGSRPGKVAIIGAGLIGRAWAMIFARAGWEVALHDPDKAALEDAPRLCSEGLAILESHGLCADPAGAAARIRTASDLADAVAGADHVQENGPERLEVKQALFAELDALCAPDTVIASSTSAIQCSLFTETLEHRGRCLVAHPVNPPHLIPVVELSGAPWTDPQVIAKARAMFAAIGQAPVEVRREIDGFILNRLQAALLTEAFRLVAEGYVTPQDLDTTVAEGLGLRWSFMGPFQTIALNAPGGAPDYCARYGPFFQRFAASQAGPEIWQDPALSRALADWARTAGESPVPERQAAMSAWRDRRLAALAAHKAAEPGPDDL